MVVRGLTVARPRGARGEESRAKEAGGGGAGHQPRSILGEEQDGTVRRGVSGEGGRARGGPLRLEQGPHGGGTDAPRHRCPPTQRYQPVITSRLPSTVSLTKLFDSSAASPAFRLPVFGDH